MCCINSMFLHFQKQGVIVHKIVEENVYNMFLILPQFAIMTAGEVM